METRNVIAAISLSAAVIILYSLFFAPPPITKENLAEKNKTEKNTDTPNIEQKQNVTEISREEAFVILKKLNNTVHYLISSVCIAKNGAMIWNHSESSELKMKNLNDDELSSYLNKIDTKTLLDYGVYQIEADGLELFEYVKGDKDSIMGLPIKEIINYIKQLKK